MYNHVYIGEFNVWNNDRHHIDDEDWSLHSVTALKVDSKGSFMYTGNSLGYIQVRNNNEFTQQ